MHDGDLLILKDSEVRTLLEGREAEIIKCVQSAYEAHAKGESAFPHSSFLRFPNGNNRIIALPAYLGGEYELAGIKWVASFPANLDLGFNRATAVIILNSAKTGRPNAMLEGSAISAKRTAGSAVLAAQSLCKQEAVRIGIIGAGVINFEIISFLMATWAGTKSFVVYDRVPQRSHQLREKCQDVFPGIEVDVAAGINTVLRSCSLISMATTAVEPHIVDLSECAPGTVVLHISLRDLSPEVILHCDNITDDIDSVCSAQTSVHLAEQYVGNRDFIRCALSEILLGMKPARNGNDVTVFSPFGMGILDLALAKLTCDLALQEGRGSIVDSFC